ncbi:MAG: hypothetical protein ACMVY4_12285 [Minwuia sp.]|uniref:hypothetical protein n=1 Tax=Minwuia sp. TaxID=2493630 RepID=UPI003A87D8F9
MWTISIADIDIWRTAWLMVERYGDGAGFETAARADELMEAGDLDGAATWQRILDAVDELQRTQRTADELVN